jgi:hypothetical protein
MDAVKKLEAELSVLNTPIVEAVADPVDDVDPEITSVEELPEPNPAQEATKLRAAETLADALDQLGEHIEAARAAAHGLVEALSPVEPAGHPLTIESPEQEPKEPQDVEVPQES